jgi:hypothetical protein
MRSHLTLAVAAAALLLAATPAFAQTYADIASGQAYVTSAEAGGLADTRVQTYAGFPTYADFSTGRAFVVTAPAELPAPRGVGIEVPPGMVAFSAPWTEYVYGGPRITPDWPAGPPSITTTIARTPLRPSVGLENSRTPLRPSAALQNSTTPRTWSWTSGWGPRRR